MNLPRVDLKTRRINHNKIDFVAYVYNSRLEYIWIITLGLVHRISKSREEPVHGPGLRIRRYGTAGSLWHTRPRFRSVFITLTLWRLLITLNSLRWAPLPGRLYSLFISILEWIYYGPQYFQGLISNACKMHGKWCNQLSLNETRDCVV